MSEHKLQIPKQLFREATFSTTGEGFEKAFHMSISSEEPYLRYDWRNEEEYYEVLDHGPGGCDESRMKAGLPILFNHDTAQPLGNAKSFSNDGKCYRVQDIAWSNSQFAQEKKKDAETGALPFKIGRAHV